MNCSDLLAHLQKRGVALSMAHGDLRYRGPVGALTEDLRAAIREHKTELIALLRADVPSDHPDPSGAAPRQSLPAETHASVSPPAFLLIDAPIVVGSSVVVVDAVGIVDPVPTSVRTIRTTVWDSDVWALLDRGEWRPLRDLRVVATPQTADPVPSGTEAE